MLALMVTYTATSIKTLRAPTVKRLLRERGYSMRDVARNLGISHSVVSRAVRKKTTSTPALVEIARLLNQPERQTA